MKSIVLTFALFLFVLTACFPADSSQDPLAKDSLKPGPSLNDAEATQTRLARKIGRTSTAVALTVAATEMSVPSATPGPAALVTRFAAKQLYVCVATANIRSGPGTNYPTVKSTTLGSAVSVSGQQGEWYYLTPQRPPEDLFMHQSVLCDKRPPTSAPRPSATRGPATVQYDQVADVFNHGYTPSQAIEYLYEFRGERVHWRMYVKSIDPDGTVYFYPIRQGSTPAEQARSRQERVKKGVLGVETIVVQGAPASKTTKYGYDSLVGFWGTIDRIDIIEKGLQTIVKWISFDP